MKTPPVPLLDRVPVVHDDAAVARFERDGFCAMPDLLQGAEAMEFRDAALAAVADPSRQPTSDRAVFRQQRNLWRDDPVLRRLTFHPRVLGAVHCISGGRPMRLWQDHILIKWPRNGQATELHQDEPYWPVDRSTFTVSAWIALGDVPVERGCMSFVPGSHLRHDLRGQDLTDAGDLMRLWPDLAFAERVLVPLRAGGATFHQGFTAHRAEANATNQARVAFSIIWVDAAARFSGAAHGVTDSEGLVAGDPLPDRLCPPI
jgi:ectoine hydroxylase-related dioxygenase (phytanoyl-CoA dioxygenase family)